MNHIGLMVQKVQSQEGPLNGGYCGFLVVDAVGLQLLEELDADAKWRQDKDNVRTARTLNCEVILK
jgi:hypothetical protein